MRRLLPRTLLRPLSQSVQRTIASPRRLVTTEASPTTTTSTSSTADDATPTPPSETVPLIVAGPSTLPPWAASLTRTRPHKVTIRRSAYPDHPKLSPYPITDEAMYTDQTERRMPLKMEMEFERYRRQGLFPGLTGDARSHYLAALTQFRNRVRGTVWKHWDRGSCTWIEKTKIKFMIDNALSRNVPESDVPYYKHMTASDLILSGSGSRTLIPSDIDMNKARTVFEEGVTPEHVIESLTPADAGLVKWGEVERRFQEEDAANLQMGFSVDRSPWKKETVGYRVYLPNDIIRLTRNYTPPGEPYDPYVATFRIPPSMNKIDLRSYLHAVYGLDVTFIRTTIYWGKVIRDRNTRQKVRQAGRNFNYKKAIVGLTQPFHYPDDELELKALGYETGVGDKLWASRLQTLETNYLLEQNKAYRREKLTRIYRRLKQPTGSKSFDRGTILRGILEKKNQRDEMVRERASAVREMLASNSRMEGKDLREVVEDGLRA